MGVSARFFRRSADHEQDWQPYPVDPLLLLYYVMNIHTYIRTYNSCIQCAVGCLSKNYGVGTQHIPPRYFHSQSVSSYLSHRWYHSACSCMCCRRATDKMARECFTHHVLEATCGNHSRSLTHRRPLLTLSTLSLLTLNIRILNILNRSSATGSWGASNASG